MDAILILASMDVTVFYTDIPKRRESKHYAEHTKQSTLTNPHPNTIPVRLRKLPPNIWLSHMERGYPNNIILATLSEVKFEERKITLKPNGRENK